jgi:mxaJ protein
MRPWALAAVLGLTLAGAARAEELRVCADPNNLPFSNDKGEGFENRIVELVAKEMDATVSYTWWAQRRGFVRNTLNAGECDLVPGVASNLEMLSTTRPYYRSTYVFVTRADQPQIASFDDPRLKMLTVGVQMVGDDFSNTPPAHALTRRGIVENVRGYMLYGDYAEAAPQERILKALTEGEIDVAIVWGPLAGYFATREQTPLRVTPVSPWLDGPTLPMVFDISMGVRKGDVALQRKVDAALRNRRAEIDAILGEYGVPTVAADGR